MPQGREYYNVTIVDVTHEQLLKIQRAMHAHKIPIEIELVIVPPTNINPRTGRPFSEGV